MRDDARLIDANELLGYLRGKLMTDVFPDWKELPVEIRHNVCQLASAFKQAILDAPTIKTDKIRWVSVEKGLPEPFVSVLCYMPDQTPHLTIREGFVTNAGIWHAGLHERKPGEVVMWRAMPTPPKMDKKETAMVCPINGAPCCECVPGAYCAKRGGDSKEATT